LWDVIPAVLIVHGLFDTGALATETLARSHYKKELAQSNIEARNKVRQMRMEAGRPPMDETAGPAEDLTEFRDAAQEAAQVIPGTSFTGPVVGPSKPGYVPPVITQPLVKKATKEAVEAATDGAKRYVAKGYRVMSPEEFDAAKKGIWSDSAITDREGKKWMWSTPEEAEKWQKFLAEHGEKNTVIAEVPVKKPLEKYETHKNADKGTGTSRAVPSDDLGPAKEVKK
jgi:hypothetical protein